MEELDQKTVPNSTDETLKIRIKRRKKFRTNANLPPPRDIDGNEIFWDFPHPSYPGYKVSQFGTILGKNGQRLSDTPNECGYVRKNLRGNNKSKCFLVQVIMALTFLILDFDWYKQNKKYIYIDHINHKRAQNDIFNLRIATPTENNLNKENDGISRPVIYISDGITRTWKSIAEASRETGLSYFSISYSCRNGKEFEGSTFTFETPTEVKDLSLKIFSKNKNGKPIVQMDMSNKTIKIWPSISLAAKEYSASGFSAGLNAVINGKRLTNTIYGYRWRYATQEEIDDHLYQAPPPSVIYGEWRVLKIEGTIIHASSKGYILHTNGIPTKGILRDDGYMYTLIITKKYGVHRLILMAFYPRDNMDDLVPDHRDRDRSNNNLENLFWETSARNTELARGKVVKQYSADGKTFIRQFSSYVEAARNFGATQGKSISQAVNNPGFTAYGYVWKTPDPSDKSDELEE